jgi:hypothetical protein
MAIAIESEGLRVFFAQDVHGPLDASLKSDQYMGDFYVLDIT